MSLRFSFTKFSEYAVSIYDENIVPSVTIEAVHQYVSSRSQKVSLLRF